MTLSDLSNSISFTIPEKPSPCLAMDKDTDLIVIKINPYYLKYVNTVESFIIPPVKNPGEIRIYGQGFFSRDSIVGIDKQHSLIFPKGSYTYYGNSPTEDSLYIDTVHHFVNLEKLIWIFGQKDFQVLPFLLRTQ